MKNALVLTILLSTVIFGCKKHKVTPFDYTISGIGDISVEKEGATTMPVEIKHIKGDAEFVSLSITGLPKNVTATINPDHASGSFNPGIVFNANSMAVEGTYPLMITTYSISSYYRTYNFNLKVVPSSGCVNGRIGNYFVTSDCTVDSYYVHVVKDPYLSNAIMIQNFGNFTAYPVNLHIILDCTTKKISIPTQTEDSTGLQFSGTGTFNGNIINLTYDVVDGPKTTTCHAILNKQ